MPRHPLTTEEGSLPLALLASILVAGLIGALFIRVTGSERAVRFDRDFTEALPVADVGLSRGLFALNEDVAVPTQAQAAAAPAEVVDGTSYRWWGQQLSPREWEVTSVATTASGVSRRLVARIEERSLFFPGAFGDRLVALQGNSSRVDSYNSAVACPSASPSDACGWGTSPNFGTNNGSVGTNEKLDFIAGVKVRPGGAFLYDWLGNPPQGQTTADPFGDRCDDTAQNDSRCTETYVRTIDQRLDLSSPARTDFIRDKFYEPTEASAPCAQADRSTLKLDPTTGHLRSYLNPSTEPSSIPDPTSETFDNFYCLDSWTQTTNLRLHESVTAKNPVVVFVRKNFRMTNPSNVACYSAAGAACDAKTISDATKRAVRPEAQRLQIFVLGESDHVSIKSNSYFAGVIYAPLSLCSGESSGGGANTDIYGSVVCGEMKNIGNWAFHYDDALGRSGAGTFNVAFWREEAPQ